MSQSLIWRLRGSGGGISAARDYWLSPGGRTGGPRPLAGRAAARRLRVCCRPPGTARLRRMPVAGSLHAERTARRGERFTAVMAAIVRRLPFGLARVVAPNMLGFAVISTFTFSVTLVLLIAFHAGPGVPVPSRLPPVYPVGAGPGCRLT